MYFIEFPVHNSTIRSNRIAINPEHIVSFYGVPRFTGPEPGEEYTDILTVTGVVYTVAMTPEAVKSTLFHTLTPTEDLSQSLQDIKVIILNRP